MYYDPVDEILELLRKILFELESIAGDCSTISNNSYDLGPISTNVEEINDKI